MKSIESKIVEAANKFARSVGISEHQRQMPSGFFARLFGFPPQFAPYLIVSVHVAPEDTDMDAVAKTFGGAINKISAQHGGVEIQWTIQAQAYPLVLLTRKRSRS